MSVLRRALNARTAALVGIAAGAALSLTACNTDGDAVAAPTASASAPGAGPGSGANPAGGADSGSASGASSASGSSTAGSSNTQPAQGGGASASDRCHTTDLNIFFGGRQSSTDTGHTQTVALANKSKRTCTVQGFPGVDLKDGTHTWSLVRSSAATPRVTLAPGDVTSFRITFAPAEGADGDAFTPTTAVITPPNETTSVTLGWEAGSIVLQDGATHPGTFVNPVVPNVSS